MTFKEMVARDRDDVFLDLAEFADPHVVDGKTVSCVIDQFERTDRDLESGVAGDESRLFAKTEDMPPRRRPGEQLTLDGRSYVVLAWRDEMGVTEVDLARGW